MSAIATGFAQPQVQMVHFISVKDGRIVLSLPDTQMERVEELRPYALIVKERVSSGTKKNTYIDLHFQTFGGYFKGIEFKKADPTKGKKSWDKWLVYFEDDQGHSYVWTPSQKDANFQAVVVGLANIESNIEILQITAYTPERSPDKTNLSLKHNGERLEWKYTYDQWPPIPEILGADGQAVMGANGFPLTDFSARFKWLLGLVAEINAKAGFNPESKGSKVNGNGNGNGSVLGATGPSSVGGTQSFIGNGGNKSAYEMLEDEEEEEPTF